MHAKRQGWLATLFDAVFVALTALFTLRFAPLQSEPRHARSVPVRSKHWGRKVVLVATMVATMAMLAAPAYARNMWN